MNIAGHPLALVALAGATAGALDILFAIIYWLAKAGTPPMRILQSVAAGVLGRASFAGGWPTAALGLVLHFAIAGAMSFGFYAVAVQWRTLGERPLLFGALYGLLLYALMNYAVVPLSRAAPGPKDPAWLIAGVAAHVLLVGIPIALGVHAALQLRSAPA